jgi:hypothetical protein
MTGSPTRPPRSARGPFLAALLLLLAALAGVMVGVALDRRVLLPHAFGGPGGHHERLGRPPAAFLDRIARELELSPDQRVRVDSILERSHREICAVKGEVQPRLDSLFTRMRREMDLVLTPEQRNKAEKFRKKHHPPDGPGPGGPGECFPKGSAAGPPP